MPLSFKQNAWPFEDDDGKCISVAACIFKCVSYGLKIVRIDGFDILNPDCPNDFLEIQLFGSITLQSDAVERVSLSSCHGCGSVVEDADDARAFVVYRSDERAQSGMGECGISDDSNDRRGFVSP